MIEIFNNVATKEKENKSEDNLFVENIIVNKKKVKQPALPYIPTEKWLNQLGHRVEISS